MNKFLLIGSGKLARHFRQYFNLLHLDFACWARKQDPQYNSILTSANHEDNLKICLSQARFIFLLISDDQIPEFFSKYRDINAQALWIHCSGSLSVDNMLGLHPLLTFGPELYDLATYKNFYFIQETIGKNATINWQEVRALLKNFPNPVQEIAREQKALYHALCVCAINFSNILQSASLHLWQQELRIPKEALLLPLQTGLSNVVKTENSLTGPLQRKDWKTIDKNLEALKPYPLHQLYLDFLQFMNLQR